MQRKSPDHSPILTVEYSQSRDEEQGNQRVTDEGFLQIQPIQNYLEVIYHKPLHMVNSKAEMLKDGNMVPKTKLLTDISQGMVLILGIVYRSNV